MTLWAVTYPHRCAVGGVEAVPSTLSYHRNVAIRKYLAIWNNEAGRVSKTMAGAQCALTGAERRAWNRFKRKEGLRCMQVCIRPYFMTIWRNRRCLMM